MEARSFTGVSHMGYHWSFNEVSHRGPNTWTIFCCFPQATSRELDSNWSSQDTNWCPYGIPVKQEATPQCRLQNPKFLMPAIMWHFCPSSASQAPSPSRMHFLYTACSFDSILCLKITSSKGSTYDSHEHSPFLLNLNLIPP